MPSLDITLYDAVDDVLTLARVIINDLQLNVDGNLLADTQPWTFPMLKLAWRELCLILGNNNVESFPMEVQLLNVVPVATEVINDPSIQVYINSEGYFDGVNSWPFPTLPADIQIPLKMWERPTGQQTLSFSPMLPANAGLPTWQRTPILRVWEWRDDDLYFCGATQANDLRLRYKRRLPDPYPSGTAPILLINCAHTLAYIVAEIFADSRGGEVSEKFAMKKADSIKQMINNTTRKKQYQNFRRQPYSRRGSSRLNWNW